MKSAQSQFIEPKLTDGSVGSHLVKLSLPMLFNILMIVGFNLTDTYFIAQLGTNELAAMSFTFPVVTTLSTLTTGLGDGAASVIALAIGEGKRYKVQQLTTDSLMLSVLIGSISTFAALATLEPLFAALGARSDVLPLIQDYMQIWYLGLIFLVVPAIAMNVIRGFGNIKVLSLIMMTAMVINIVLDPLLIFGWGGFPRLEIKGAALATVIAQATTLIATTIFIYRERMLLLGLPKFKQVLKSWQKILYIGLPAAATNAIAPISIAIVTSTIAFYGSEAIAGFGIASRLESLALIAFLALSASIGPVVGQNWGAGKIDRVNRAFCLSLRFCLIWGSLAAIVLSLTSSWLASVFNSNREVVSIVSTYMTIVPISYATSGIILISSSTFIALGRALPSAAIAIAHMFILYVPLTRLGSQLFGVHGIFVAICFSNLIVGLGAFLWNRRTRQVMAASDSLPPKIL